MTPKHYQDKIKEIQLKYPLSFILQPIVGIIQHVDSNDTIVREELVSNNPFYELEKYEQQAKESHELSLSIQKHRNILTSIFDISDMD